MNDKIYQATVSGYKFWFLNKKYHRINGPAIIHENGSECWYIYNKLHRIDGAAIVYSDQSPDWYLNGDLCSKEEYKLTSILLRLNITY